MSECSYHVDCLIEKHATFYGIGRNIVENGAVNSIYIVNNHFDNKKPAVTILISSKKSSLCTIL